MSLTSYRAAPPRDTSSTEALAGLTEPVEPRPWRHFGMTAQKTPKGPSREGQPFDCEWVIPCVLAGYNAWRRPTLPTLER